jgi:cytochrome b561
MEQQVYHPFLRFLHWTLALLVLGLAAVGFLMSDVLEPPFKFQVYGWHKALGMMALGLMAARVLTRLLKGAPPLPADTPRWQVLAARINHLGLYAFMLLMPMSGYVMSVAGGHGVDILGWDLPRLVAEDKALAETAHGIHVTAIWILLALVAAHVAGVIKHSRDGNSVLPRMWKTRRP